MATCCSLALMSTATMVRLSSSHYPRSLPALTNLPSPAEFFVARQYTFESHLSRPFSLGFTVPDVDSDEEEVDVRERCGSQQNPLVLDSDSDEDEDVTMAERLLSEEEPAEDVSEYQEYPESATRSAFVEETYSDQDGSVAYSSDGDLLSQSIDVDIDSDAASIVSSAMEYPSEPEVPDSEDEDGFDLYNDRDISDSKSTATASVQALEQSLYTNTQTVQSRNAFSLDHEVFELPHPDTFNQTFGSSFTDAIAPPLPPRRSPSRAPWNNTNFTAFGQQLDSPGWSDEMPAQACYMAPTFGDRSSVFGAQPPPMQESIGSQSNSLLFGQTPPPMPALDVTTPPPQPARRTKVTIEEIVEDQPPTPESVNNLKRKANVLSEEPQSPVAEEAITFTLAPAVIPCEAEEAAVQTIAAVPETIVIAQRPKKQPKSILSRLGDTARVSLFGAAGAFVAITALSTLPDTFFT